MSDKVFFEVTALIRHVRKSGTFTGIQRTVVSVIAEAMELMDRDSPSSTVNRVSNWNC